MHTDRTDTGTSYERIASCAERQGKRVAHSAPLSDNVQAPSVLSYNTQHSTNITSVAHSNVPQFCCDNRCRTSSAVTNYSAVQSGYMYNTVLYTKDTLEWALQCTIMAYCDTHPAATVLSTVTSWTPGCTVHTERYSIQCTTLQTTDASAHNC
eukprot:13529-Heterococcus_DN1.PRE.6